MIYEEYFSVTEPISFQTAESSSLALHVAKNYGLHTGLLRVSNQIHSEAAPYLYSNPEFNFVGIRPTRRLPTTDAAFAYFLRHIGNPNVKLLRHFTINFFTFRLPYWFFLRQVCKLDEDSRGMLKQIHDQCTELVTLRMELPKLHCLSKAFTDPNLLQDEMTVTGWLNEQLQVMPFLRDIAIHVQVFQKKLSYKYQGWREQSQKLGWKFEITEYEGTGNEVDDFERYYNSVVDLADMQYRMQVLQRGYYIKRQTTNGESEIDYELSYRVACRKIEEGLLQSA